MIQKVLLCILAVLFIGSSVHASENLTFSGVPPTVIPATFGQYYNNISEGDHRWVSIGNVVPRPFVDYFGEDSELGWQVFFLIIIGSMFIILFGRQANVILPLLVFMMIGIFTLPLLPDGLTQAVYTLAVAAMMGVIIWLARSKR